VDTSSSQSNRH